jgi:hypothetical protein
MLGVLMTEADHGKDRSRFSAALDLLRGAVLVHTRYWWGPAILLFVVAHLVLAGRTAARYRQR